MEQLPKRPLDRLGTPLSTITTFGLEGEAIQVPITLANVKQVDELVARISKANLSPLTYLGL
jgi:hypothetical protein